MITAETLSFLRALKKNNDKTWFDTNRKKYEAAKKNMEALVNEVIALHGKADPSIAGLTARECLFRINRDIRFAKDKSPYKTNFGASINADGRKAMTPGYYLHLEPGKSFAGGGLYQPAPADLRKVRQEIDYHPEEFRKLIEAKSFKSTFGTLDQSADVRLTRVPQGFDKESEAAPYLMYRSYIAMQPLTDELLQSPKAAKTIAANFAALQPLLDFLRRNME
ncbi:DUF2461 domain-containing protein [Flavihumibacter petaseus]|uniref:TIGR02453 family protein n=1 Tax=Flavihumibacter petaseus NBRC 106054 TaxID=1220578 RepID=A0A0E9MW85_9BACT|nr:DUF2461 domain-containing protein [Flavihumibacter petaseus]GAO41992.1 hypothetical protein FPE01S_01_10050 [Flavihumibacter petaseus NBRC 106054]